MCLNLLPSFLYFSLLLRTELCPAGLFLLCPLPSVAIRVCRFANVSALTGIISQLEMTASERNVLKCWPLSRDLGVSLLPLGCCLWNPHGLSSWWLSGVPSVQGRCCCFKWICMAARLVPDPDFCHLQVCTIFLTLQSRTFQCLKL